MNQSVRSMITPTVCRLLPLWRRLSASAPGVYNLVPPVRRLRAFVPAGNTPASLWRRILSYLLIGLLALQPVLPAMAAGVSVASGNTATTQAGNGVPVVNIATPNQAGISHNRYQDFNVGSEGLILNNATGQLTQTQLGGLILNNPNLQAGKEAQGIINEVVGGNRSQLQGYLEVAGKSASVIVANPYGITCNGCGFINTPNATLTTGKPVMGADGSLQGFEITQGDILIEGKGLDAGQSDAFSLLTRATEINAALYANDLTVVTGANHIDATGKVTALDSAITKPSLAVDTGLLGGMYANRIRLVSNDTGVGVNLGNLSARAGDITLSASGQLTVNNAMAQGALSANGEDVRLGGDIAANGAIAVNSNNSLAVNNATLAAGSDLTLNAAGRLSADSAALTAGVDGAGNIGEQGTLTLRGGTVGLTGTRGTASLINVQGAKNSSPASASDQISGDITLDGASALQARQLSLDGGLLTINGQLQSNNTLSLSGSGLSGGATAIFGSQQDINLDVSGAGQWSGQMTAGGGLHFQGESLNNSGQLLAAADISLNGNTLDNQGLIQGNALTLTGNTINNAGHIQATGNAAITAQTLTQQSGGEVLAGNGLTVDADHAITNGLWQSQTLNYQGMDWQNVGHVNALDNVDITLSDTLQNNGDIQAAHTLLLAAASADNAGRLQGQQLSFSGQTLDNSGALAAERDITLTGLATFANSGTLLSGGLLNITAVGLDNYGEVTALNAQLSAENVQNDGTINISGALAIDAAQQKNSGALAATTLTLSGDYLDNAGALAVSDNAIFTLGRIDNFGTLSIGNQADFSLERFNNTGTVSADSLHMQADQLTNSGLMQGRDYSLTGGALINSGTLQGSQALNIVLSGQLSNLTDGQLLSDGQSTLGANLWTNDGWAQSRQLIFNGGQLTNNGTLLASDSLQLTAPTLLNQGALQGGQASFAATTLANSGTLLGLTTLALTTAALNNQTGGRIFSAQDLSLTTGSLQQNGQLLALGNLDAHITGALDLANVMAAGNRLTLRTDGDLMLRGTVQGVQVQLISGGQLTQSGSIVAGGGGLSMDAAGIVQQSSGSLQSGGDMTLTSRGDINNQGFIGALGNAVLQAASVLTNSAMIYTGGDMRLLADGIRNIGGTILAGNSLWMQRDAAGNSNSEIINTSGDIETQNGDITLNTAHLLNQRAGFSVAQSSTGLNVPRWAVGTTIQIPLSWLGSANYAEYTKTVEEGGGSWGHGGGHSSTTYHYYLPIASATTQRINIATVTTDVISNGNAGRLVAGHNLNATAGNLENIASTILAGNDINLQGGSLSNQSYIQGTQTEYLSYHYSPRADVLDNPGPDSDSSGTFIYVSDTADGAPLYEYTNRGQSYDALIQAGGNVTAGFSQDISNTTSKSNIGGIEHQLTAPSLTAVSQPVTAQPQDSHPLAGANGDTPPLTALTPAELNNAIQTGLSSLTENPLADYPLPSGNSGLFVINTDPNSHYLITTNPNLEQLGKVDGAVFSDLQNLLGQQALTSVPVETSSQWTDKNQFLGSAYLLDKLGLNADYDYLFLGDAAFDTRYISNAVISQTGQRYVDGVGSDLAQMQYLLDNAAAAQQALGLQFGVSLTADQVAGLTQSIVWWEPITVDGQTVLAPKLYLAQADDVNLQGSVISGQQVALNGGGVINSGVVQGVDSLDITSQSTLTNQGGGLLTSKGGLDLTALNDISNLSSAVEGGSVSLTSLDGSVINQTQTNLWSANSTSFSNQWGNTKASISATEIGATASISATDGLTISAGKDISVTGATIKTGGSADLTAGNDVDISAISQASSGVTKTQSSTTTYGLTQAQGGSVDIGGAFSVKAGDDVTVNGVSVTSGDSMTLAAGNDLNLLDAATGSSRITNNSDVHSSGGSAAGLGSGGSLSLSAGNDIIAQGALLAAAESVTMAAGGDIALNALQSDTYSESHGNKSQQVDESIRQQATEITAGKDITLTAGQDLTLEATQAQAGGAISASAGGDINVTTAQESDYHYAEKTTVKKHLFSKTTTHTVAEDYATHELGALLSGDSVNLSAGNNIAVTGSSVIADDHVTLQAGNDIDITAATEEQSSYRLSEKKTSGMFSGGGIGVTFGSSSTRQQINQDGATQSQSVSTIGATEGNVNIIAGGTAHLSEAQVIAGNNLNIVAGATTIEQGNDLLSRRESYEQKQSGLTVALHSPITDALLSLGSVVNQAADSTDNRMKALYAVEAIHTGWAASQDKDAQAQAGALANGNYSAGVKVEVSVGSSQSSYLSTLNEKLAGGSTLSAGGDVNLVATGGNNQSGDLRITDSGVTGNNVTLLANRDLILDAADSTTEQKTDSSSSGWNVGVHIAVGPETGIGVSANGYLSSAKSNGSTLDYLDTRINAQDTLSLTSGRDTVLSGAQALGDKIIADVGGDLTLTSLQDTDDYTSAQKSISGGLSFTVGTMTGSASLSMSSSNIDSQYASVGDQSGLFAGDGGYNITVGDHTQLNGAVIASTAAAQNNALSTGTLGWSDIDNQANYSAGGYSLSGSWSHDESKDKTSPLLIPAVSGNQSGSASGTTGSAIADGTLTLRDAANQQQDVATLSHDTADANGHIDKIFDKDKVEQDLAFTQAVGRVSMEVVQDALQYHLTSAEDQVREEKSKTVPGFNNLTPAEQDAIIQATPEYKAAQAQYGIGSPYAMAGQAISGALAGLAGGSLSQVAAGGLAPYLALAVKAATTDPDTKQVNVVANALGHALAGGLVAYLQGGSVAAGAVGAAGGELAARAIMAELYPGKSAGDLTEEQKQTVSMLGSLAAGLAGAVASNSSTTVGEAAASGKNAVENNGLTCTPLTCKSGIDLNGSGLGGGIISGGGGAAIGAAIADAVNGDKDPEAGPNVGKDLTDEEKAEVGGAGSGTGSPTPPDNEQKNQDEDKPSNIKMVDDKYLKNNGIDAHKLKEEFLGDGNNAKFDIYVNKDSGELWIFRKGGKGDGIQTGEFIK